MLPRVRRLEALLAEAGFETEEVVYASFSVAPSPFDRIFMSAAASLARRAASLPTPLRSISAMHVVIAARKSGPPVSDR